MNGFWRLTVTDSFAAAHALRHYQGKCEKLHGHNFSVAISVEGISLEPGTEILMDFKILKNMLKSALEELDHSVLNDVEPFKTHNPSSENLARHIAAKISSMLAGNESGRHARLASVTVCEKPGQEATWVCEPDISS